MSVLADRQAEQLIEAGDTAWNQARPDIASDRYAQAEAHARASGDRFALARALTSRGIFLYELGDEEQALALHEEALRVRPEGDRDFVLVIQRRMATCLMDLGRFAEADAVLGPEPSEDRPPEVIFGWRHYRMQLAERMGDLDATRGHAADIRDDWTLHGHRPEIRRMANAMIVATKVRAVLGTDAERAALGAELADFDEAGLSLNLRSNLAMLRAEMAFDAGDPDGALAVLEDATATFATTYGNLPAPILSMTIDMLQAASRSEEIFDWLDRLWQGGLSDGSARLTDAPPEAAELVAQLVDLPDLAARAPSIWQDVRLRAIELSEDSATVGDGLWKLNEVLARRLDAPRSRLLMAKRACAAVALRRASDLVFPEARRRYADARMRPFETALGLLYDMGRLAEARAVHDLSLDLRRAAGLPSRLAKGHPELLSGDERAVADLPIGPDKVKGLIDGTIWPDRPAEQVAPRRTHARSPTLRYVQTERGWILDATGPSGGRRHTVDASVGTLSRAVHAVLSAGEAGGHDPEAASVLRRALLDPVSDLLAGDRPIMVSAGGALSALPFSALIPDRGTDWLYLRGRSAAPEAVPRCWRKAALLHDGQVDARREEAALRDTTMMTHHVLDADGLDAALSTGAEVLHVAGHFETRGWDPAWSGLRRADGGVLTVRAIESALRRHRAPPLVCLGLCETAGILSAARGEVDLPGLFLNAGSSVVIATAWRIGDSEAGRLARRFYTELARDGDPTRAFSASRRDAAAFMLFVGRGPE